MTEFLAEFLAEFIAVLGYFLSGEWILFVFIKDYSWREERGSERGERGERGEVGERGTESGSF